MDAFLQVLRPLYERRTYYPGADMGTSDDDFLPLRNEPGKRRYSGLRARHFEGLPLEDQLTGFGVVESALVAAKAFQLPIRDATVAIEGFGKVGAGRPVSLSVRGPVSWPSQPWLAPVTTRRVWMSSGFWSSAKSMEMRQFVTIEAGDCSPGARSSRCRLIFSFPARDRMSSMQRMLTGFRPD